jgi:hypothetical protein
VQEDFPSNPDLWKLLLKVIKFLDASAYSIYESRGSKPLKEEIACLTTDNEVAGSIPGTSTILNMV